jgi:hypothetical protein
MPAEYLYPALALEHKLSFHCFGDDLGKSYIVPVVVVVVVVLSTSLCCQYIVVVERSP